MDTGDIIALGSLGIAVIVALIGGLQYFRPNEKTPSKKTSQTAQDNQYSNQIGHVSGNANFDQRHSDPDVIKGAVAGATQGLQEQLSLTADELAQVKKERDEAIEDLEARIKEPNAPAGIEEALAQLEEGRTEAAEDIFQEILNSKKAEGETAHKEAAAAARHIGALAFLHDTEKALSAYRQAVDLDPDDPGGWNQLGRLFHRIGTNDEAKLAYEKVLALGNRIENQLLIAMAYGNLGTIYQTQGDIEHAKEMYLKALEIDEKLDHKEGMANNYGNLGNIYFLKKDSENAELFHKKSLMINRELNRTENLIGDYVNLGNIYQTDNDLEEAENMFQTSLSLAQEIGLKGGMADSLGNLGNLHKDYKDFDKAEEMYKLTLKIEEELQRKEGMANCHANLGLLNEIQGRTDKACEFWSEAVNLFEDIGAQHTADKIREWMENSGCKLDDK